MNRTDYADLILERLKSEKERCSLEFRAPSPSPLPVGERERVRGSERIRSFFVDDLLPEEQALKIFTAFPAKEEMVFKNTLRERKHIAAQMNRYDPILEEIIYAFQDPRVVALVSEITGILNLIPDEKLYAGGISLMAQGNYLNPHLDNSHDLDRKYYRLLNLLYYVTPEWKESDGGHLELWDRGVQGPPRTIFSFFNRLVVMETGKKSWHSVNPVRVSGCRCCVSNYFFAPRSSEGGDYFHVTSFRGRPEAPHVDFVLQCDNALRMGLRKFFKKGVVRTKHLYEK